jgi:mannose-1-phosphate guanylyltransferase
MDNKRVIPVILAGGVGSRLWPLSRQAHPKPFIKLADDQSLIQKTYLRALEATHAQEIITIINRELFFTTQDEYEEVARNEVKHTFILEPVGRNSSAAIALAAHYAKQHYGDDCTLLILPADHLIEKQAAFNQAVQQAATLANDNYLVTFGIQPDSPKTGYGYIEADSHLVKRFVEKPSLEIAETYLAAGNYYWNSGMFCFQASCMLAEMQQHCPDIAKDAKACLTQANQSHGANWQQLALPMETFAAVEDISIDYAVFEKSQRVAVIPCDIGWSDIGSWLEYGELHPRQDDNHVYGEALLADSQNCVVHAESRLVAALGLKDLVIADTADALLVAHKDKTQQVRKIVDQLKQRNDQRYRSFETTHRPWGTYTVLQEGPGYKLKQIVVKPGASLSLQSHQHRSEHWVVVSGIAKITNGDKISHLKHNESTYIPAGNRHRLENKNNEQLILIEVQCGTYLGEDDIVRHEDKYNRNTCTNQQQKSMAK